MRSLWFCLILAFLAQLGWSDEFSDTLAKAEKGDVEAQFYLGAIYSGGKGVPKGLSKNNFHI